MKQLALPSLPGWWISQSSTQAPPSQWLPDPDLSEIYVPVILRALRRMRNPPHPAPGGNPAQLAQGISIALYNTAFGILIAIPALIAYNYFSQHARRLRARMEDFILEFLNLAERNFT